MLGRRGCSWDEHPASELGGGRTPVRMLFSGRTYGLCSPFLFFLLTFFKFEDVRSRVPFFKTQQ